MKVAGETPSYYFGDTPEADLARAAAAGKTDEITRLVNAGANVNAVGQKNMSPLAWALTARNTDGMRALLQSGADPNQSVGPEREFHPVWLAAVMDTPEPLRVLLDFKGNPNAPHKGYEFNALRHAIMQLENVKLLVQAGADVNAADSTGRPVAVSAASLAQYDVVVYLLEHGFHNNLPLLAWEVNDRPLSPDFEPKRQKTLAVLKAMGVIPTTGKAPAQNRGDSLHN